MAEEEINYASVVFKTKTQPRPEAQKEEDTVYDEVKVPNKTPKQAAHLNAQKEEDTVYAEVKVPHRTPKQAAHLNAQKEEDTVYDEVKVPHKTPKQAADMNVSAGFLSDKKATNRRHHYQLLACCLGTFCVILLLGIIALSIFLLMNNDELKQLKNNQTTLLLIKHNLTEDNNKLRSENENLRRNNNNLTVTIGNLGRNNSNLIVINGNLTEAYAVIASKITNLTAENQKLTAENNKLNTQNQELEAQNNKLTEQIGRERENSVQKIIDAYCPIDNNNNRQCKACERGWLHYQPSCYAINNAEPPGQKTWEEAQHDCREKISFLAVIVNEDEKKFINDNSWRSKGVKGYWIGLRVEDGRWKWIDGSNLTESSWTQPPTNGHCAISVHNEGWKSVNCGEKNGWICKKKALSV
ncbi:C-type lectin domain family 4 member G-like isoform X1 [Thunnus albacares]|uniref:C-type lectin domain family 4 member G-like isoform X1 n=1 Tax=Thunnus albacares TaxID=8236 RepID=UPI001CF6069C|nr:C-type lectin domain family 4 member G-like isoform X1 [Thunnus albacares]XP_044214785.1 C-type lectin domain family 4 member G-like isoform X1 [Thunnus albacares]